MKKSTKSIERINTYLVVALVVVLGIGLYFTLSVPSPKAPEPVAKKIVQVMVLGTDCEGCFNTSIVTDFLAQQETIEIESTEEYSIEDSADIVEQYGIEKLPAVVITGETEDLTIQNFEMADDALVFADSPPPYYDVEAGEIAGLLELTVITDEGCDDCFDIDLVVGQLKQLGIALQKETTLDVSDAKAQAAIEKYDITQVPTLYFNDQAAAYDLITSVWDQVGSVEEDGSYVLRKLNPPYKNVETGKLEGLVDITYLVDKSCEECYDVNMFKDILVQSFNMVFDVEQTVDVSDSKGKLLVDRYNIELVPTVILSKDAGVYPAVEQAWEQAGSVEKDGKYVFRKIELLEEAYKNITTGEVLGLEETADTEETVSTDMPAEESSDVSEMVEDSSEPEE